MSISFVRDVYARHSVQPRSSVAVRRAMSEAEAATSPRSSRRPVAARPAQPLAASTIVPFGMRRVSHIGCLPWESSCTCSCHGDPRDACDVVSCVDIAID